MTPLDAAYAAMEQDGADEADRLRFYEQLADGEYFLLLEEEALGTDIKPRLFPLESGPVVLIFDLEERLAEFSGGVAPYAALPGRVIAQMLAGQGVGLGVNLGVAPSQMILPPEALDWLSGMLEAEPEAAEAHPEQFTAPGVLPPRLIAGLEAKLARGGGVAQAAYLAAVTYRGGRRGHMLAFLDAAAGAEAALARTAREALAFSGVEAGEIDVAFLSSTDPATLAIARVGRRFDMPRPAAPEPTAPKAPGTDPDRPPKLR
jgi:hypothetical protein